MDNLRCYNFLTTDVSIIFLENLNMKTSQLVRTGIIISAFFLIVAFFQVCLSSLMFLLSDLFSGTENGLSQYSLKIIIVYFVMFLTCLLILRKSNAISDWLTSKANYSDSIGIKISHQSAFMIILISYSFFEIVGLLTTMLTALFQNFTSKVSGGLMDIYSETTEINWISLFIKLAVYFAIMLFAKRIAAWFQWSIESDPEDLSFGSENTSKTNITEDEP